GVSNIAILNAANNFNNLTISAAGTVTQTGLVDVSGTLTVNAGAVLASSTFTLTAATLAANMAGGLTAGAAGTKTINGNVSIAATGFVNFGGATWTFSGSWTNSSTSGSWSARTGTVVRGGAGTTVKILNSSNGFGVLTISGTVSAASAITTAGFVTVSGTLDTTGTNYGLTIGGGLTVSGPTGVLRTNASTISVTG